MEGSVTRNLCDSSESETAAAGGGRQTDVRRACGRGVYGCSLPPTLFWRRAVRSVSSWAAQRRALLRAARTKVQWLRSPSAESFAQYCPKTDDGTFLESCSGAGGRSCCDWGRSSTHRRSIERRPLPSSGCPSPGSARLWSAHSSARTPTPHAPCTCVWSRRLPEGGTDRARWTWVQGPAPVKRMRGMTRKMTAA